MFQAVGRLEHLNASFHICINLNNLKDNVLPLLSPYF